MYCVWHDLEHQRMKKNRINDESMENWSALHINGRKVHYREQSLVVATAKIIIMSALGPNPCLAPSSASISRMPFTFGVTGGPPLTQKSLTHSVPYFRNFGLCTCKWEIFVSVGDLLQAVPQTQTLRNVFFLKSQNLCNAGILCKNLFFCLLVWMNTFREGWMSTPVGIYLHVHSIIGQQQKW